jgi:hypothetical protein
MEPLLGALGSFLIGGDLCLQFRDPIFGGTQLMWKLLRRLQCVSAVFFCNPGRSGGAALIGFVTRDRRSIIPLGADFAQQKTESWTAGAPISTPIKLEQLSSLISIISAFLLLRSPACGLKRRLAKSCAPLSNVQKFATCMISSNFGVLDSIPIWSGR